MIYRPWGWLGTYADRACLLGRPRRRARERATVQNIIEITSRRGGRESPARERAEKKRGHEFLSVHAFRSGCREYKCMSLIKSSEKV